MRAEKEQQTNVKVIEVEHIDLDNYKEYIGKTVKVKSDVDLSGLGLTKIPIDFTEVCGDFDCPDNKLTSLKGALRIVGGSFNCSNNELVSLSRWWSRLFR